MADRETDRDQSLCSVHHPDHMPKDSPPQKRLAFLLGPCCKEFAFGVKLAYFSDFRGEKGIEIKKVGWERELRQQENFYSLVVCFATMINHRNWKQKGYYKTGAYETTSSAINHTDHQIT